MELDYVVVQTMVGPLTIGGDEGHIHTVRFGGQGDGHRPYSPPGSAPLLAEARSQLDQYFKGSRTRFDLEMIQELGYCTGIENDSRHLSGRQAGEPPPTLLDYFPDDYLVVNADDGRVREATAGARRPFVRVEDGRLFEGDLPYRFVGANLWYGVPLASEGPGGDRQRLRRLHRGSRQLCLQIRNPRQRIG